MTMPPHPEARGDDSRFAILFNHLTDAVFIHDFEGHFLEVNDTACQRLGYSRDELLRMSPADIDDPDSRALIGERVATLRKEGRLLFEAVHCSRSGEQIAVEIHSQVIPFDGREVILSVVRDIRRRKALEAAMAEAEAALRALLDALPESALLLDEHGKVKALNSVAAARFGLSPEAMLGQDFFREGLQNLPARLPGWDNSDMKQMSLEAPMYTGFELRAKRTRKRAFLEQMDRVVPWAELVALIEPYAPKAGPKGGRPPFAVEKLLRIHFLQQWFGLSDPAVEEALYDTPLLASFVGLDLGVDVVPDESTILRFRHLLEQHGLSQRILETVNRILTERGLMLKSGTIVDATLIAAPSSTKNARRERDPEMHQTKKGNQWYFGMKAHVGVDAETGLVHTVVATAANVSDVTQAHRLLHGQETDVFADAGYQGVDKRAENQGKQVAWHVAMRPGKRRALDKRTFLGQVMDALERTKARIRAKGEHPFRVLKCQFGYRKTPYRGLAKNGAQLNVLFALVNLWLARKALLAATG
jgi:IS5 family transposase